ncbi:hypothetical protein BOTBODRAFT_30208 [Botryobasidium botryosum FD-172 SS1]|uniref:Uncharacterized protein n=1 Tax=Botryobasidium botryosum (strain FD-172 SS1) TaxID=930990 RepID=A0A067MRT5_BOTB1|nr:hypothetical protein BOTBODRAFT_30208 [Botryobasidium botryosum FD-172 SS1]
MGLKKETVQSLDAKSPRVRAATALHSRSKSLSPYHPYRRAQPAGHQVHTPFNRKSKATPPRDSGLLPASVDAGPASQPTRKSRIT